MKKDNRIQIWGICAILLLDIRKLIIDIYYCHPYSICLIDLLRCLDYHYLPLHHHSNQCPHFHPESRIDLLHYSNAHLQGLRRRHLRQCLHHRRLDPRITADSSSSGSTCWSLGDNIDTWNFLPLCFPNYLWTIKNSCRTLHAFSQASRYSGDWFEKQGHFYQALPLLHYHHFHELLLFWFCRIHLWLIWKNIFL